MSARHDCNHSTSTSTIQLVLVPVRVLVLLPLLNLVPVPVRGPVLVPVRVPVLILVFVLARVSMRHP